MLISLPHQLFHSFKKCFVSPLPAETNPFILNNAFLYREEVATEAMWTGLLHFLGGEGREKIGEGG